MLDSKAVPNQLPDLRTAMSSTDGDCKLIERIRAAGSLKSGFTG